MKNDLVTIVLPTYNCAHFLPRAIESVLCQTYAHWELLIIDNYSTDTTVEVVQRYNDTRISFLQLQNEGVIAKSRNLGINTGQGRWVAFLDADDWWTADKLAASVQVLQAGCDLVYHALLRSGPGKRLLHGPTVRSRQLHSPIFCDLLKHGNAIPNSSVVVCRKLLLKIGGLSENPQLVAAEDFDAWLRISRETEKFHCLKQAYGFYWIGEGNVHSHIKAQHYLQVLKQVYFTAYPEPPWFVYAMAKARFQENDMQQGMMMLFKLGLTQRDIQYALKFALLGMKTFFHYWVKV